MNTQYALTTTLSLLKKNNACHSGYRKLVKHLGTEWPDTKPINLLTILESNGVQDMLWCLRATRESSNTPSYLMAADFAESVLHLFTKHYPNDDRPAQAIRATRDFAHGKIKDAAWAAARAAAWAAAWDAAWAAARAAAWAAAGDAAWAAARAAQRKRFADLVNAAFMEAQ